MDTEVQDVHDHLSEVAKVHSCTSSRLSGTTSRHVLPDPTTFRTLAAMHAAARVTALPHTDFVATSGKNLVFAVKFGTAATHADPSPSIGAKKRRRGDRYEDSEHERQVDVAHARIARASTLPPEHLSVASDVLKSAVRRLRGPHGESVVQSFAILDKKLQDRRSAVVAMRLNAGVPVPVSALKQSLGSCWNDGALTTAASISGVCASELPLSEEAEASLEFGNASLLVVSHVPWPP